MQIIIPMSGFGERFRRAGYEVPKPLIEIDGKPIIAHVIDMFPGETDFIFICNQDHLDNPDYGMASFLQHYCPTGQVVGIAPHKLGPIHAVRQAEHLIKPDSPVIVNYCDFTCYWDWQHFKNFVKTTKCVGAIPAYKGFHPHTLGCTNYAYLREHQGWVEDIQEKQPYTHNRMEEFASSGTYYFESGNTMSEAFRQTIDQQLNVGGEYYVSLAYKPLLTEKQPVVVYPLQHFMQWGTPDDVREYNGWSTAFKAMGRKPEARATSPAGTLIIPMAGMGQRFAKEGYTLTKPLIHVSGRPMVTQATEDLPNAQYHAFVIRQDMPGYADIANELKLHFPHTVIETVEEVTEGQACTALIGLEALQRAVRNVQGPITFGACDNGSIYNEQAFQALVENPEIDVIVWGVKGHSNAIRHPQMFGWIDAEKGRIRQISVKIPLESPATDPIVVGTFTFRRAEDFHRVVSQLIQRDGRINGEFYIDSTINDAIALGLRCELFEIDAFLSWGTPNELRTFEYWQSCFHKWSVHPYRLENDSRIPQKAIAELEESYRATTPELPSPLHDQT